MKNAITLLFILCLTIQSVPSNLHAESKAEKVSKNIRNKFESILFTLEPATQKHFAVRMYRISGDRKYIYPIIYDLLITTDKLKEYSENLSDTVYIKNQAKLLLDQYNDKTRKGEIRRALFKNREAILFDLDLLYKANKLIEYHIVGSYKGIFDRVLSRLRMSNLESFLLDSVTIRDYAPQAVNYVYNLKSLQIADIRPEYKAAFEKVYPDSLDMTLSDDEFMDKIYGMTHFIFAASEYYQHTVDSAEFNWILNYFDRNINRIIEETKSDIIAEVGICFLLCDIRQSDSIELCKKAILKGYDKNNRMILSSHGSPDAEKGEHRNTLAVMLLSWPDSLYPGPFLNNFPEYRELK